ncbi:MAG: hypothetical protein JWM34_2878 [Ilumatobacteraceae bacterium]|nr:hypothetical protein [Ilumatobacteraceae bacterium]
MGVGLGLVVTLVVEVLHAPWQLFVLAGWDAAALVMAGSIWIFAAVLDGAATRAAARREDLSSVSDDLFILAASVVSLAGVIVTLVAANHHHGALKATMIAVAIATVALSWTLVHTLFTLRYARLFYGDPEGGIDFGEDLDPDYRDFAYVAFTVGMTFQVSDTNITARAVRRTITRQALLGYVFGTVIIGVTINVVGGLVQ